jgi:predicted transcriptional regulator
MAKEKIEQKNFEQTPEQIREILVRAVCEKRLVDLVILSLEGRPDSVPDLIVEEIQGDVAWMSYVKESGELGEVIPLELSRIKKAEIVQKDKSVA